MNDYQCFLTNSAGEVIEKTFHNCNWIYDIASLGYFFQLLGITLLWILGIGLSIGFIVWIFWITNKTKILEKKLKRSNSKK